MWSLHGSRGVNTTRPGVAGAHAATRSPHGSRGVNSMCPGVAETRAAMRSPHGPRGVVGPPWGAGGVPQGSRGLQWGRGQRGQLHKCQKCIWGSQNPQIRRTRMKKSRLVILGAPRCSKVLKVHFVAFGPSNVARRPMKTHFFKK